MTHTKLIVHKNLKSFLQVLLLSTSIPSLYRTAECLDIRARLYIFFLLNLSQPPSCDEVAIVHRYKSFISFPQSFKRTLTLPLPHEWLEQRVLCLNDNTAGTGALAIKMTTVYLLWNPVAGNIYGGLNEGWSIPPDQKLKYPQELSRQQKSEVNQVGPGAKKSPCPVGKGQPILASVWEWGPSVSRPSHFVRNARNLDFYVNSPHSLKNLLDF